jgi:DNA repair ATPase RecN
MLKGTSMAAERQVEVVGEAEDKVPAEVKGAIDILRKYAASPEKIEDLKKRLATAKEQVRSLRDKVREADALADKLEHELRRAEKHAQMIDQIEGKEED